jgi:hypothetical protein
MSRGVSKEKGKGRIYGQVVQEIQATARSFELCNVMHEERRTHICS